MKPMCERCSKRANVTKDGRKLCRVCLMGEINRANPIRDCHHDDKPEDDEVIDDELDIEDLLDDLDSLEDFEP